MKLCIITGAKGGAARTTTAVRVAQSMHHAGVAAGIVDLSPFPTAHLMVSREQIPIIQGAGVSTTIGAESVLRPYREKLRFAFIDTGRLDAAQLAPWLPLCSSVLIASPSDRYSLSALPALWSAVEEIRKANDQIRFMGILPVLVDAQGGELLGRLRARFPGQFLEEMIPFDPAEVQRSSRLGAGELVDAQGSDAGAAAQAWSLLAKRLMREFDLTPTLAAAREPAAEKQGLLGKLWRMASNKLGRGTIVGKGVTT